MSLYKMSIEKELSEKAFQLCSKFLCGEWKDRNNFKGEIFRNIARPLRTFLVEKLNGGLTNKLYICSTQTGEGKIKKVVLRIYGLIMQVYIYSLVKQKRKIKFCQTTLLN